MNQDEEQQILLDILSEGGKPMSSPELADLFKAKTGVELSQAKVYRRMLDAKTEGRTSQDAKRRWIMKNGVRPRIVEAPVPDSPISSSDAEKLKAAAGLLRLAATELEASPPNKKSALEYRRSADVLLGA